MLEFGHFSGRGGGMPDSKDYEVLFLLWVRHFPRKMGEADKNPNTLRNFSSFKIGVKKVPQSVPKIQRGDYGRLEKIQTLTDFYSSDGFPK